MQATRFFSVRNTIKRKKDLFSLKRSATCAITKNNLLKRFATSARAEVAQYVRKLRNQRFALQIAECPPLVKNMPIPTDVPSVQRFVGFVNYFARFLPKLAELCEPLRRLTDKNEDWKWTDTHQRAFDSICKAVTCAPVLKYFNVNQSVVIQCDASQVGLGATLLQNDHPVAYASRSLTLTEQRYAQIEKECLAIVFACEKFEHYILGKEVLVNSDHKPLEVIFKKPLLNAPKRLKRMLLRLQKFDMKVVYKQGITLHIADFLSRASLLVRSSSQCETDYCVFSLAEEMDVYNSFETVNLCENLRLTDQRLA